MIHKFIIRGSKVEGPQNIVQLPKISVQVQISGWCASPPSGSVGPQLGTICGNIFVQVLLKRFTLQTLDN